MTVAAFDRNAQKTTQIALVTAIAIGYLTAIPALVWVAAALLATATFVPGYAPQLMLYRWLVRMNTLTTQRVVEDTAQHRFAQYVGLSVLSIAIAAHLAGALTFGWSAALLVLFLAVVNVTTGFCAGCFVYAQIARIRGGVR